ncbi:MAG: hypothetical protein ACRERC_12315 [Candidatus Binatia bacterium]
MNDRVLRDYHGDLPHMLEVEPPPGVWQARASLWCGALRCPKSVAVAASRHELGALVRSYVCPRCGRGNLR